MKTEDVKLAVINGGSMALSFSDVEAILKIVLLVASIVYTVFKIVELKRNQRG
jgi:hypothetical protein